MGEAYRLQYPIHPGTGAEVTEVRVRRLKGADFRRIRRQYDDEDDVSDALLCAATGLTLADLDALDGADFVALEEQVKGFFSRSPATGGGGASS